MIILLTIIGLSLLILVHELGHYLAARFFGVRVEEFGFGFPPRVIAKKFGETVYSFNLLPFGGFVKIYGEDGEDEIIKKDPRSFTSQPTWKKSTIVLSGVLMNVFLAWLFLSFIFTIGSPQHLAIADIAAGSPAEAVGLKAGDVILKAEFGGRTLKDPIRSEELISLVKAAGENEISLDIGRGGKIINFKARGRINPPAGQGSLGINLAEIGFPAEPLPKAFFLAAQTTVKTLALIFLNFLNFFSKIFVEPKILENVAGPVGIFFLASGAGALGIIYLVQFLILISLNLAVLNLIPFPALDGGRFLLLMVEKIKGSPLSRRFQLILNAVGFAALIILMIVVTIEDISKVLK
jgi:regulator of sigma E protease